MHRSRLAGLVIDCQSGDLARDTRFWSQALGHPTEESKDPADADYVHLATAPEDVQVLLQKVDHPSRVHLDIETDDIEAEVRRLEKLGAKQIGSVRTWVVMEAPSGHRFCVVRPQRSDFDTAANRWDE